MLKKIICIYIIFRIKLLTDKINNLQQQNKEYEEKILDLQNITNKNSENLYKELYNYKTNYVNCLSNQDTLKNDIEKYTKEIESLEYIVLYFIFRKRNMKVK